LNKKRERTTTGKKQKPRKRNCTRENNNNEIYILGPRRRGGYRIEEQEMTKGFYQLPVASGGRRSKKGCFKENRKWNRKEGTAEERRLEKEKRREKTKGTLSIWTRMTWKKKGKEEEKKLNAVNVGFEKKTGKQPGVHLL